MPDRHMLWALDLTAASVHAAVSLARTVQLDSVCTTTIFTVANPIEGASGDIALADSAPSRW